VTGTVRSQPARLAVLISGRGSNLQAIHRAILDGRLAAEIAIVIANRPEASGLAWAREAGLEAVCLDHRQFRDRGTYDRVLVDALSRESLDLVCLAGFMRLLGDPVIRAFPHRILNIHPSLLPAFPGLDAQRQALEHGVKVSGATVHFVTPELDAGPIVRQAAVPVHDDDTVESLSARILVEEHRIYPEAIDLVLGGRYTFHARRFIRLPESETTERRR
jgi:phosphoribosylglycinamide formyltransferase-1